MTHLLSLCANSDDAVFHPKENLITYRKVTIVIVCMKQLTGLFIWTTKTLAMFNLCVETGRILFWRYSWCPCPKAGRESNQPESRKWSNPTQEENFSSIKGHRSFRNQSCRYNCVKDTIKVTLSLLMHTKMTLQKWANRWTFQMWVIVKITETKLQKLSDMVYA